MLNSPTKKGKSNGEGVKPSPTEFANTVKPRASINCELDTAFHSGSTMLNLCLNDIVDGGLGAGKISNLVADSSTGKSLLALTMLAEIANNTKYDDYDLIYDDIECAMAMNISKMFGKKASERIIAPEYDSNNYPMPSITVEQLYARINKRAKEPKPFIYVVDCLDALTDASELDGADELSTKMDKAKTQDDKANIELSGSYGTKKPKLMSQMLRVLTSSIANTKAHILFISQVRDNINAGIYGEKHIRAGGKALTFYCESVIWLYARKKLEQDKEIIGRTVDAVVKKNKRTGKKRSCSFDIFDSYGIDDTASCIDFLIERGVITMAGAWCSFEYNGEVIKKSKSKLASYIEQEKLKPELLKMVQKAWDEKEEQLISRFAERPSRFE